MYLTLDDFLRIFFPGYVKETVWKVFYTEAGQLVSVGNYWRDPHHILKFITGSVFLPVLDNLLITPNSSVLRNNFKKLNKLVLIGGPDDGIIEPWESRWANYLRKS